MFRLIKMIKDKGRWRIFKLKLIDARLYFVSIFVGLLTGLVAVPYHYLLQFFFNLRHDFFDSRPKWYWYIPLFLLMWGILVFVSWLVKKMPLITGGGIPQTRGVINGRVDYKHPFLELVAKFVGGILALSTGLSLGREGPSVQIQGRRIIFFTIFSFVISLLYCWLLTCYHLLMSIIFLIFIRYIKT